MSWTDESRQFALDRAALGDTASAIVRQLTEKFGINKSRNAVIGIVHRKGGKVGGGSPSANKKNGLRAGRIAAAKRWQSKFNSTWGKPTSRVPLLVEPLPPHHVSDVATVAFIDLEDEHCRFVCLDNPVGPYIKQFCGAPRIEGLSYCLTHAHRCHSAPAIKPLPESIGPKHEYVRVRGGTFKDLLQV